MNHVVTARCRIVLASSQCRRRAASHVCVPAPRRRKPHASLLHNAAFCKVSASHYAKASFCVCHRFAPFGFAKQALCKVACASGASSLPATGYGRGVPRPPRPRLPGFPRGVPAFFLSQCASRRWPLRGLFSPAHPGAGPCASRTWPRAWRPVRPPGGSLPQARVSRRALAGVARARCALGLGSLRIASKTPPKKLERVPQSCLAVNAASRRLRGGPGASIDSQPSLQRVALTMGGVSLPRTSPALHGPHCRYLHQSRH